jgi:aspartate-semialdehyde dehydrogenase
MKQRNVIVLGATGTVGQRILSMLDGHPWMRVSAVAASERSAGKRYGEAARWHIDRPKPAWLDEMPIRPCEPNPSLDVAFSALDASVAGEIELAFASAGVAVVSNARNHRMEADIPLIVPEVNADQLRLIPEQRKRRGWKDGCIVTNPNCSTIGLVMALKPLHDAFGIDRVAVTTMQALSGAGYPGVPSADILDNVLPFIKGEEEKMQTEPLKILGVPRYPHFGPLQSRVRERRAPRKRFRFSEEEGVDRRGEAGALIVPFSHRAPPFADPAGEAPDPPRVRRPSAASAGPGSWERDDRHGRAGPSLRGPGTQIHRAVA